MKIAIEIFVTALVFAAGLFLILGGNLNWISALWIGFCAAIGTFEYRRRRASKRAPLLNL